MSRGLGVFGIEEKTMRFEISEAIKVIEGKLDPTWIQTRKQGTATLSYIGGHTVIRLLNKAFNYQWSFEVVSEEVKPSLAKPAYDGWGKNRKARLDSNGQQIFEAQPPVAQVLGRLTVPGLGVKEQYGSKVLIGGATEQESVLKSAATDAMKKCASLFGIGLELYGEDEGLGATDQDDAVTAATTVQPPAQQQQQTPPVQQQQQQAPQQQQQQAPPVKQDTAPAQTATAPAGGWNQDDINRLKELKAILGITDNVQLDPYVREFFDNPDVTWANITPENIKAVNIFLTKKAEVI